MGLELLQRRLDKEQVDPEVVEIVGSLRESCSTAVEILNELLQYEKIEAGLMTLEKESIYPLPFILKACSPFLIQAQQKGIELSILTHEMEHATSTFLRHWKVSIDQSKMSQVLRNFCSNAIKFTESGGKVDVTATLVEEYEGPTFLRIEVKDSGFGIAPENQHKVFNEVVQFHANKLQGGGGSGFGLVISKRIVDLHGGRIGLFSEGEGTGCTFFVDILAWRTDVDTTDYNLFLTAGERRSTGTDGKGDKGESPDKLPAGQTVTKIFQQESNAKTLTVLIVDDSGTNRKMTRKMLEYLGHKVLEADDGDTAIETYKTCIADSAVPDMILLDNHMPRMRGPEAATMLRRLGYVGYIAALTGDASDDDKEHFIDSGADVVLVKPINSDVIKRIIDEQVIFGTIINNENTRNDVLQYDE